MRQQQQTFGQLQDYNVVPNGRYYEYEDSRLVVTSLKVGHNSLARMAKREGWKARERRDGDELLILFRDPTDRLRSAYQFFTQRLHWEHTWEEFVDHILAGNRNNHWLPQSEPHENPTRYMEFTKFLDVQENASEVIQVDTDYRKEEVREYYKEDWKIWTELTT